jgi:serine/threonine protein kinase
LEELGGGKYGVVKLARNIRTCKKVAVKIIEKGDLEKKNVEIIRNEIDILKILTKFRHPNIIKIYGITEDSLNIYIFMKCMEKGNLNQFL